MVVTVKIGGRYKLGMSGNCGAREHEVIGPDSTKLDNIWEDMFIQLPPIKGQRS